MADRPLSVPLPADLPEDWTSGQTIAPAGADVGLSEQHGYNYLMAAVNRAQQAVNAINESFDNISGKRTCRFVVGTSTAGWTQADCDYLCDGTDDQEEINKACNVSSYGEIVLLTGNYNITAPITIRNGNTLRGNGVVTTTLWFRDGVFSEDADAAVVCSGSVCNLTMRCDVNENSESKPLVKTNGNFSRLAGVAFYGSVGVKTAIYAESGSITVSGCFFMQPGLDTALHANGSFQGAVCFLNNYIQLHNKLLVTGPVGGINAPQVLIMGNTGTRGLEITLDSVFGNSAVIGNKILKLELLNTDKNSITSKGVIIAGNNFSSVSLNDIVITLGEGTRGNFVTGNNLFNTGENIQHQVQDLGTQNIIRFNSNDTGGGSGTAGVSSFNGRTGAVFPASGDYTAAMVGAIPTGAVAAIQELTQAEYDALTTKSATTLYLIKE